MKKTGKKPYFKRNAAKRQKGTEYKVSEEKIHKAFVTWARTWGIAISHSPNELVHLAVVLGRPDIARRAKLMGVQRGIPDVQIYTRPTKAAGARGVGIEFKSKTGTEGEDQERVRAVLSREGWLCFVCHSVERAKAVCVILGLAGGISLPEVHGGDPKQEFEYEDREWAIRAVFEAQKAAGLPQLL